MGKVPFGSLRHPTVPKSRTGVCFGRNSRGHLATKLASGNDRSCSSIGQNGFTAEGQVRAIRSGFDTLIELNMSGISGAQITIALLDFTAATFSVYGVFP